MVSGTPFAGNNPDMDQEPATETVDQTLLASAERVRTSRELLDEIDSRLARGAELLDERPVIDLRSESAAPTGDDRLQAGR